MSFFGIIGVAVVALLKYINRGYSSFGTSSLSTEFVALREKKRAEPSGDYSPSVIAGVSCIGPLIASFRIIRRNLNETTRTLYRVEKILFL
jgi:hypothetical protein